MGTIPPHGVYWCHFWNLTETFLAKLSKTAHAVIANTFGVEGEIVWEHGLDNRPMHVHLAPGNVLEDSLVGRRPDCLQAVIALVMDLPDGTQTGEQKMRVKKFANEWKIVGPAKE